MLFCWVEPNARHSFTLAVFLFEVCSRNYIHICILAASCCILVTKHLEIVLKHIDDFIRLKCFFDTVLNSVDEFVKLLIQIASCGRLLTNLIDEVIRMVLDSSIDASFVVGLRLKWINSSSCLETHWENLFLHDVLNVTRLALKLQVDCQICSVLLNHLIVVKSKLFTHFWDAHLYHGSTVCLDGGLTLNFWWLVH